MMPDTNVDQTADAEPDRESLMAMSLGSKDWEDRLAAARIARAKVLAEKERAAAATDAESAQKPATPDSAPSPQADAVPAPRPAPVADRAAVADRASVADRAPAPEAPAEPSGASWLRRIAIGAAFFAIGIGGGAYVAHLLAARPAGPDASIALTPPPAAAPAPCRSAAD